MRHKKPSKKEQKRLNKINKLIELNKEKTAKERHNNSRIVKLSRNVRRVKRGAKVFKFVKEKVVPVLLIAFAAVAYKVFGVEIPKEKKRKGKR